MFAPSGLCDTVGRMTAKLPFDTSPQPVKLTAREFWLLADAGAFTEFVRTELIEGEILVVNAVHSRHARAHARLIVELGIALKDLASDLILLDAPSTELSDDSIPEPDIAIARRAEGKAVAGVDVLLAVEVSDSTVEQDLGRKQRLYARHGIPEYWVADLPGGRLVRMWAPEGEQYAHSDEWPFGARVESATIDGLAVETSALVTNAPR
jgi:Uma2 family endonuclease